MTVIREGFGTSLHADGSIYEGWYKNDKRNGGGRLILSNGDVAEGTFKDDLMIGKGTNNKYDGTL